MADALRAVPFRGLRYRLRYSPCTAASTALGVLRAVQVGGTDLRRFTNVAPASLGALHGEIASASARFRWRRVTRHRGFVAAGVRPCQSLRAIQLAVSARCAAKRRGCLGDQNCQRPWRKNGDGPNYRCGCSSSSSTVFFSRGRICAGVFSSNRSRRSGLAPVCLRSWALALRGARPSASRPCVHARPPALAAAAAASTRQGWHRRRSGEATARGVAGTQLATCGPQRWWLRSARHS